MKLIPLLGLDELRFGDSAEKAVELFGKSDDDRLHSYDGIQTRSLYWKHLTLGFDAADQLMFIAAHRDSSPELWGERPFEIAMSTDDEVSAIRSWILKHGRQPVGHQDCFGGSFEVAADALIFFFEPGEPNTLGAIQLYPKWHK